MAGARKYKPRSSATQIPTGVPWAPARTRPYPLILSLEHPIEGFPAPGVPLGINIQDPEETSDRSSKTEFGSLHFRNEESSPPNSDSKTPTPSSTPKTTTSDGAPKTTTSDRTPKAMAKRKAFKVVATTPVRLFIPFVLGVLLTVNHNAPSRTCTATEMYSALMSRIVASESPGVVGTISRFTVHTVVPILILLVIFVVLCWLLQLPTFILIKLQKENAEHYGLNDFYLFTASVTPTGLAILLQRIDFIPAFRGCELPALTTWLPWIPNSWFQTGISWIIFIIFTFFFSFVMSINKELFPSKVAARRSKSAQ